jgi:hypothetical protein
MTSLSWSDSLTEVNGKMGFSLKEMGVFWYTILKQTEGIWAGVYGYNRMKRFSFSLRQYTTAFQGKVHALKAYAVKNIHSCN